MSDCAPDGWGRRLIRRADAQRAREADTQQRSLAEIDFLLGARDDLRQGALRFRGRRGEQYLAVDSEGAPDLTSGSRGTGFEPATARPPAGSGPIRPTRDFPL